MLGGSLPGDFLTTHRTAPGPTFGALAGDFYPGS